MMSSQLNIFDKFCNIFPDSVAMKQIAELALIGKVISSYKIDSLTSFHDQLMQGLWKKSSNGFLYPLDNRLQELLYVQINENFKADTKNAWEKLQSFNIAQKVFNEMSEPILSTNQNREVLLVGENAIVPENSGIQASIVDVGVVDKELSDPILISDHNQKIIVEGESVLVFDVAELADGYRSPEPIVFGPLNEMPQNELELGERVEAENEHNDIKAAAFQVFDKMSDPNLCLSRAQIVGVNDVGIVDTKPIPHFMLEMAQIAQPTQDDPTSGDREFRTFVVSNNNGLEEDITLVENDIGYKDDSSILCNLEQEMYTVDNVQSENSTCRQHLFEKMVRLESSYFKNLVFNGSNRERFFTLGLLSNQFRRESPPVANKFHVKTSPSEIENWKFKLDTLQPVLFHGFTLEDKGDFRGEEGGIYTRDTWELIMDEVSCHNCLLSQIDKSIGILTYTFDPGGLTWDGCKAMIIWSDFVYSRTNLNVFLDSRYERGGEYHDMEAQMKVFDPGLVFKNKGRLLRYNAFEDELSMANVFCVGEYLYRIRSSRYHYHANSSNMLLASGVNNHDGPVLIFDPGENDDFLRLIQASIDVNYKGLLVVARPDLKVRFEDDGCVLSRYLQPRGPINALNTIIHAEGIRELWRWVFLNVKRVFLVNMWLLACSVHAKFSGIKSQMVDVKEKPVNQASNEGGRVHSHVRNDTSQRWVSYLLLEYCLHIHDDSVFVFDPGGFYVSICSSVAAILILEDKDHLKGSVMIHFKLS